MRSLSQCRIECRIRFVLLHLGAAACGLVDDGLRRGTHAGGELRLGEAETPAHVSDLVIVVGWNLTRDQKARVDPSATATGKSAQRRLPSIVC